MVASWTKRSTFTLAFIPMFPKIETRTLTPIPSPTRVQGFSRCAATSHVSPLRPPVQVLGGVSLERGSSQTKTSYLPAAPSSFFPSCPHLALPRFHQPRSPLDRLHLLDVREREPRLQGLLGRYQRIGCRRVELRWFVFLPGLRSGFLRVGAAAGNRCML